MKKSAKTLLILTTLFLVLTSCSATANHRQPKPDIKQLCILPPEPVYDYIRKEDSMQVKFLKLLNNEAKKNAYIQKLKATIQCLSPLPKHAKHLKHPKIPNPGGDRSASSIAPDSIRHSH